MKPFSTALVVAVLRKGGFQAARFSVARMVIRPGYKASALDEYRVGIAWFGLPYSKPEVRADARLRIAEYLRAEGLHVEVETIRLVVSLRKRAS